MSFWGGLWGRVSGAGELSELATLAAGVLFVAASLVLGRRVLTVFGCLGCFGYMGHLAWLFKDSLSFPVALTVFGLAVIAIGVWFQKNLTKIEATVDLMIPASIQKLIPRSRLV